MQSSVYIGYNLLIRICEVRHFRPFLLDRGRRESSIRLEHGALTPFPSDFGYVASTYFKHFARRVGRGRRVCYSQDKRRNKLGLGNRLLFRLDAHEDENHVL